MKPNKRIIVVSSEFPPEPGGIGTHALYLSKSLSENGFAPLVITDQRSDNRLMEERFDKDLPFEVLRIKKQSWRPLMYLSRIYYTLKNIDRSVVVMATGKFSLWNVAFCKRLIKFKAIAIIHGSEVNLKSSYYQKLTLTSLRRFDEIVAVSNYTKGFVSPLNLGIKVIPNGIYPEEWECQGQTPSLKGFPKLLTVGRLSERKGQLQMIRHLPSLISSFPNIHYHCIGMDKLKEDYIKAAEKLGVLENISFHGVVDSTKLRDYLCASDMFVMLSKEAEDGDIEGFGIAILEANATGTAAIGSKNSGIEDAINNNKSGILINADDSNQLLMAINTIIENKSSFESEALSWASAHNWRKIIHSYIALLK